MTKTYHSRTSRLTAAFTNCGKVVSPATARQRNVMITARSIARLERKLRDLKRQTLAARLQLRFERKALKLYTCPEDMGL